MKSTSSLETSTSMILWDSLTIFSLLSLIPGLSFVGESTQDQLLVARQLRLHLFEHFLVGDSRVAHLLLVLLEDLAGFFADPVLDRDFFDHRLANALGQLR